MDLLILGGTVFLGRAVAVEAVGRGHAVTCLARGTTGTFPADVTCVVADRTHGPSAYGDPAIARSWDAVVDVSWDPVLVGAAVDALGPTAAHWTYVSSCSVYADHDAPGGDESGTTLDALPAGRPATLETYGEAKVACESRCGATLGDRLHVVRAGLIGGAGDPSDRTTYWPARFATDRGHPVVVPDDPTRSTQVIDVLDLAAWIVDAAERRLAGTYDAVGVPTPLGEVLGAAAGVARAVVATSTVDVVAIDPDWLLDHGVQPWSGADSLPLWIPRGRGMDGFCERTGAAASAVGLRQRPLADSLAGILDDERRRGLDRERTAGLSTVTERELLAAWDRRDHETG